MQMTTPLEAVPLGPSYTTSDALTIVLSVRQGDDARCTRLCYRRTDEEGEYVLPGDKLKSEMPAAHPLSRET